jgi:hypothetical protein
MQQEKKYEVLKKYYREYYKDSFPFERLDDVVNQALCIKEETIVIMKAMDDYAASQRPTGAEWVKAKPVNNGFYAVKYTGGGYGGCGFKDGEWNQSLNDSLIIAYLDESPPKEGNKEREMSFAEWLQENRWFSFENGKWYYTFEQGTCMSDKEYQKKYVKTTAELCNEWDNQQNNNHDKTHR